MVGVTKICDNIYISSINEICNTEITNNNISKIIAICEYKKYTSLPSAVTRHYIYCGSSIYENLEQIFTIINTKNVLITCKNGVKALCAAVAVVMAKNRISMQAACEIVNKSKLFAFSHILLNDLIEWENFLKVDKTRCYNCALPITRCPTQIKTYLLFRCVDCAIEKCYIETEYAYYTTSLTHTGFNDACMIADQHDVKNIHSVDHDVKNPLLHVPLLLEKMQRNKPLIACKHRPILVLIDFFAQLQHHNIAIFDNAKELSLVANNAMRRFLIKNTGEMYEFDMFLWLLVREFMVNYFTISHYVKKSVLVSSCTSASNRCFMHELALGNYFDFPLEFYQRPKQLEPILEISQHKPQKPKTEVASEIFENFDRKYFSMVTNGTILHPRLNTHR